MTDIERGLILRRLFDKGVLPWDDADEFDLETIKALSERERAVLADEIERETRLTVAGAEALLRMAPRGMSRFARLKARVQLRWGLLRIAWAKKRMKS